MAVQDYKINYKSDFVLTINGDAGWAVPFCIKFWTGMPSQAYFVGFDGVKYVNCRVGDTPTQLLVMFDDHHLPIGPLKMQIAYHTTIEEFPGSVFDEVTNARDVIVTIDGTDYQVMLDFTGEDAPELEFNLPAYANEAERIQNELQRQQNEADRIAAELQREQATAAAVQGAENVNAQLNGTTLVVTNRQGVSTSVNTKGEQGEQGPTGPEGPQGETGISIVSFLPKSETAATLIYTITYSNGHTQDVAIPKGAKGDTGATGPVGPQGPQGQTGVSITGFVETGETETATLYNITFSNGTTQQVAIPKGEKGDQGPVGPQGPQGPMGDVAVITPEQQAAFTMYSTTGQLVASAISYDNSHSGLAVDNVQEALDEVCDNIYDYETINWVSQTTTLFYYINGSTGLWAEYNNNNARYVCRILPISTNTKYRLTAGDDNPINFALLNNNNPADHVGDVATDWNNGIPKGISAGESIVIDSGEYTFLYVRNNSNSSSTDIKYPKTIEKQVELKTTVEEITQDVEQLNIDTEANKQSILDVESKLYPYLDNIPEVNYAFSTNVFGWDASYKHAAIPVSVGEEYIIEAPSGVTVSYCFATSNVATSSGPIPFIEGMTSAIGISSGNKVKVTIPDTCTYLLVYNTSNVRPFLIKKEAVLKKVQVKLGYDYIMGTGNTAGDFGQNENQFPTGRYLATSRFIKTSDNFTCKFSCDGHLWCFFYSEDMTYIGYQDYTTDIQANSEVTITESRFKYSYVKFHFRTNVAFTEVKADVSGNLDSDWDVYNVRPSNGYHRICVMVNVSDARCSDATTSTVQDEIDLRPNYGVIALPTTYSNTGKPTRLIIYCHGAGTYFNFSNATGFNTREHVDPTYWLKEGYAVMDIDGNPMWNPSTTHTSNDSHAFRPQAMNAYIAGYKWAIEHYNLYRDGVLLGGRSMGGGNTMYLLRSTCPIPVVAACANLPTSVAMNETASAKLSIANIRGFVIPDGFTFSNGVMTDADTQVYYDNWDKSIRYVPSIALCVDTPTTEEWRKNFIKNCCHVGEPYESNRIAACKDLHMIIRAPFKMFGCFEDPNNGYQATAQLYMTMLGNAGQQAEYRLYHSDKATNYPSDSRSAHYYELADPTLRTTATTVYGEEVTNVPMVYIEMLQFWRRYEQNM